MRRGLALGLLAVVSFGVGCSDSGSEPPPSECGGCSVPPMCDADGQAPSPYPPCSCGCIAGQRLFGGECNENGCIVPDVDGGAVDAGATDGGALDAGATDGSSVDGAAGLVCDGPDAASPAEPVTAPSNDTWTTTRGMLPSTTVDTTSAPDPFPMEIDPATCTEGSTFVWLPFGSAYADVHQTADGDCEVWLGGETEDPSYDGTPTQYCRFPPACAPVTAAHGGGGGPAFIDSPYCL